MTQQLITLSGRVNGLKEGNDGGIYMVRFRIDDRPLVCYLQANLIDGDMLKVVAEDGAEPIIVALRNEKTKVYYGPPQPEPKLNIFMIIFGIITIPLVGVGFFILWMAWDSYRGQFRVRDYAREVKNMLG